MVPGYEDIEDNEKVGELTHRGSKEIPEQAIKLWVPKSTVLGCINDWVQKQSQLLGETGTLENFYRKAMLKKNRRTNLHE